MLVKLFQLCSKEHPEEDVHPGKDLGPQTVRGRQNACGYNPSELTKIAATLGQNKYVIGNKII